MACLDINITITIIIMYNQNSDHPKSNFNPAISPRISFSNDFADSRPQIIKSTRDYNAPPVSSDFEFSVSNNSMMTADELFFKGRLLPFKDSAAGSVKTTLRDELLAGEDDDNAGISFRPPKASSTRWKGFLGLRKSHIGSKRSDKGDVSRSGQDAVVHASKTSQEMVKEGGGSSSCRDMEFRM